MSQRVRQEPVLNPMHGQSRPAENLLGEQAYPFVNDPHFVLVDRSL